MGVVISGVDELRLMAVWLVVSRSVVRFGSENSVLPGAIATRLAAQTCSAMQRGV